MGWHPGAVYTSRQVHGALEGVDCATSGGRGARWTCDNAPHGLDRTGQDRRDWVGWTGEGWGWMDGRRIGKLGEASQHIMLRTASEHVDLHLSRRNHTVTRSWLDRRADRVLDLAPNPIPRTA